MMTEKQKHIVRAAVLLLILVAAAVWKGQVYFSAWEGTVAQVVVPAEGRLGYVVVRDELGRTFRVDLPREQLDQVGVGDKLAKDRMTLTVKLVEKAPPSEKPVINSAPSERSPR